MLAVTVREAVAPNALIYRVAQKTGTICFLCLNFVKYWRIFKIISLSESGEHL